MLLQYNFQNSKTGQTKVNVIYSKNQTLSKVTIINGTRFRINYPYNITNNLTSNVLVIQKIKFGDNQKLKSSASISKSGNNNSNSLELNIKKLRVMSQSIDNKQQDKSNRDKNLFNKSSLNNNFIKNVDSNNIQDKNNYIYRNKLNSGKMNQTLRKKQTEEILNSSNINYENYEVKNHTTNKKHGFEYAASPIMKMPLNMSKNKILPSINNKSSGSIPNSNNNGNIYSSNNSKVEEENKDKINSNDITGSPYKIRMGFIKRFRYNEGISARNSLSGVNNNIQKDNLNQTIDEKENNQILGGDMFNFLENSNKKLSNENKNEKNPIMQNNINISNMKAYLV